MVGLLKRVAAREKASPAHVAPTMPLAQRPGIVSITGTTRLERFEESLGAAAIALTRDDLRKIEPAIAVGAESSLTVRRQRATLYLALEAG